MLSNAAAFTSCIETLIEGYPERLIMVAGTDTEVGKTYVTAALAKALVAKGFCPYILKPIQTGVSMLEATDASWAAQAVYQATQVMVPWHVGFLFPIPATPAVSDTERTLSPLAIQEVINMWVRTALQDPKAIVLCELAGGLRVPLCEGWTNLELLHHYASQSSIVLVARTALGTLNHTLLSVERCFTEQLPLRAVILNHGSPEAYQVQTTHYPEALATVVAQLEAWLPSSLPLYGPVMPYV
ncbi:MAG: dethiobiotin synthase [Vampirovibrionales bacterium]